MLTRSILLSKIRELGPFADEAGAERALHATLAALGEQLMDDELTWLASELPEDLGRLLRAWRDHGSEPSLGRSEHDFFQRIAAREAVWIGLATEHAQVVLEALGLTLPYPVVRRLEQHLPDLARLLHPPAPPEPAVPPARAPRGPHDLAEGRPGGTHPLSSANTSSLAHRHSVARNDDPHADTKLSSARGLTQEREEHTLASGHPGADNPISTGR